MKHSLHDADRLPPGLGRDDFENLQAYIAYTDAQYAPIPTRNNHDGAGSGGEIAFYVAGLAAVYYLGIPAFDWTVKNISAGYARYENYQARNVIRDAYWTDDLNAKVSAEINKVAAKGTAAPSIINVSTTPGIFNSEFLIMLPLGKLLTSPGKNKIHFCSRYRITDPQTGNFARESVISEAVIPAQGHAFNPVIISTYQWTYDPKIADSINASRAEQQDCTNEFRTRSQLLYRTDKFTKESSYISLSKPKAKKLMPF